jgi:hypothetical protein
MNGDYLMNNAIASDAITDAALTITEVIDKRNWRSWSLRALA